MMKRYILWDNDGVLVDTEPLFYRANKEVLRSAGVELTDHDIEQMMTFGYGIEDILRAHSFSEKDISMIQQQRIDLYQKFLSTEEFSIPGSEQVVSKLAKNYQMAIVTSSPRRDFEVIHRNSSILQHMDFVLTREDYKKSKPDPEPYRLALARFGIRPEQAIVVEDSARGLRSAQAANIDCIILRNEFTENHDFKGAFAFVDSHAELVELIAGTNC